MLVSLFPFTGRGIGGLSAAVFKYERDA